LCHEHKQAVADIENGFVHNQMFGYNL
jgi:hypothetical protein